MVEELHPIPEGESRVELHLVPNGLLEVVSSDQAEDYVQQLKAEFWADIQLVEERPEGYDLTRDHLLASAYARMEIASRLFDISPHLHPDYTPEQTQQANLLIDLVLEARERAVPPAKIGDLGHLGRPQDLWADERVAQLKQRREQERKRGRKNVISLTQRSN